MAVFVNKHSITKYLTGNKISDVLQSTARAVHPDCLKIRLYIFPPPRVESGCLCYWIKMAWLQISWNLVFNRWGNLTDSTSVTHQSSNKNTSTSSVRNVTKSCNFLEATTISYQILSQLMMKWENINPYFVLLFSFSFSLFFFSVACLHHIMALSNDKTSCTFLCPSIAIFVHKKHARLYGGLWPAPELLGKLNL